MHKYKTVCLITVGLMCVAHVVAASVGSISRVYLAPSNTLYTDQLGDPVVITGPVNDPSLGNASGQSDDGYSGPFDLGFRFLFYGRSYTSVLVNTNGTVTFTSGLSEFTPSGPQNVSMPLIAPFFADMDTTGIGAVYVRTDLPNELIVTWNAGYYAGNTDKTVTAQLVLRGPAYNVPSGEGQIGFWYGAMQWEVGDSSGGDDGFCPPSVVFPDCVPAAIGFGAGDGSNGLVLDGSMSDGISGVLANHYIWFSLDATGVPVPKLPKPLASPGQNYIYVGSASSDIAAIDPATNSIVSHIPVSTTGSRGIAPTPDGTYLYVSSAHTNLVSVLSPVTGSMVAAIDVGSPSEQLVVSPDGSLVYVLLQPSNQVAVIRTATKTVSAKVSVGNQPSAVAFSRDSSRAYVTNFLASTVSVIDTATNAVIKTFATGQAPTAVAVANGLIYVTNSTSNTVTVYDSTTRLTATIGTPLDQTFTWPSSIAVVGNRAVVTNANAGSLSIIDLKSNSVVGKVSVGTLPISVALSTDGGTAYVANEFANSLSVVDLTARLVVSTVQNVGMYPVTVAVLPAPRT